MAITVRLNGSERVIQKLRKIGGPALTTADVLRGVGELGVRSIQRGIREQRSPDRTPYKRVTRFGQSGERLEDTKRLLRSITYEVDSGRVRIGTKVVYAAMQHFGGVQRPSRAKALAIPLTRQVARAVAAAGDYKRAFPDAFIFRHATQGAFLVRKNPNAGPRSKNQLDFLAVLKKSVRITGTRFMGLSKQGEGEIIAYIERAVQRLVEAD